jgi:hypothetical protein
MSDQEKKVSACVPVTEREAINFGRGGYYAPEGTPEYLRIMQNLAAEAYYTEKAFREGVGEQEYDLSPEAVHRKDALLSPEQRQALVLDALTPTAFTTAFNAMVERPSKLDGAIQDSIAGYKLIGDDKQTEPEVIVYDLGVGGIPETKAHVEVYIDSSLSNIDPAMLQMRPEGFGVSVIADFDKKAGYSWPIDMSLLRPSQAHADRAREAIMNINAGLALEVPISVELPARPIRDFLRDWTVQIENNNETEVGEGVTEMAQKILDETGMSSSELIANSSINDFTNPGLMEILAEHPPLPASPSEDAILDEPVVIGHISSMTITRGIDDTPHPLNFGDMTPRAVDAIPVTKGDRCLEVREDFREAVEEQGTFPLPEVFFPTVDLSGILPDEFDPDNAEHAAMLKEAIEQGKIIDTDAVMQKPAMIKGEDIRETAVPIPTDLIREFFTNKGIYYLVDYQKSRLKGSNFLTYLTNLNVPTDVIFGDRMEYDEYSELMQAYLNQRSVITCPLLHVMAAELLLFAKGFPRELTPYMTPTPLDSYLFRFVDENKEQINRWLHFIDSTQVFALSAIKRLNEHYKPAEIFPVVDDKEYVGSNIAQLYRIPEFIAYYFSMEDKGIKYELSYFKPQFEEYMFKNERLALYFRSPHNFAAMMFEHVATGSFKGSEVGLGLFNIGVYAPDYKGPEYDGSAYAPKDR